MLSPTTGAVRSTTEDERRRNIQDATNMSNENNNPCKKELELSYKCMSDTGYDRDKCSVHFKNYNACKEFWNKVTKDRRSRGILPYLPYPNDRDAVKEEYFKKWKVRLKNKDNL